MEPLREVEPLPYQRRQRTFFFLFAIFIISLPFLYLYATGYRFDPADPNAIVKTGGIYVAAERTGAEIYIDDELVRETRVFRTAFYAQNLQPKTHKVHVQKEGHHTWVKELPVTSHRVTEAQAFNMPVVPKLRVVSEYVSATGSAVVKTVLAEGVLTNEIVSTTTKATSTFMVNPEYQALITHWVSTSSTTTVKARNLIERMQEDLIQSTTTPVEPTTTKESGGVTLSRDGEGVVSATWVGNFEQMPYYYCATPFPPYESGSTTIEDVTENTEPNLTRKEQTALVSEAESVLVHPVQEVEENVPCDRRIPLNAGEVIRAFDFFPQSTDFVVLELPSGIYMMEIDARAWQNKQPLIEGENLRMHVENGNIFVYDGILIYQIILDA